jgi:hypothetical protein
MDDSASVSPSELTRFFNLSVALPISVLASESRQFGQMNSAPLSPLAGKIIIRLGSLGNKIQDNDTTIRRS